MSIKNYVNLIKNSSSSLFYNHQHIRDSLVYFFIQIQLKYYNSIIIIMSQNDRMKSMERKQTFLLTFFSHLSFLFVVFFYFLLLLFLWSLKKVLAYKNEVFIAFHTKLFIALFASWLYLSADFFFLPSFSL